MKILHSYVSPPLILLLTIATYAQTSLQDKRDGKTYKTVKIGTQIWMAENLNYDNKDGYSSCYDDKEENCTKYGRLYRWSAADKACPAGWHLPTRKDWYDLFQTVGGKDAAIRTLKSKNGWINNNGTDSFGFSALPYGCSVHDEEGKEFDGIGTHGAWRSATQKNDSDRESDFWYWVMSENEIQERFDYYYMGNGFSVRCIKD